MNKKLLRTTLLLLISFCFIFISASVYAANDPNAEPTQIVSFQVFNPLYSDTTHIESEIFSSSSASSLAVEETTPTYTNNKTEIVNTILSCMSNRTNTFKIYYSSKSILTTSDFQDLVKNWVEAAFKETNLSTQGDYLRYCWVSYKCSASYTMSNGLYNYVVNFDFTYYTTKAQEEQLTTAIQNLIKSFKFTSSTTDKEKIDTIYSYITSNIKYDYGHINTPSYRLHFTAYAALINKTAVCEGYSLLLYRLARECGLNSRIITGYGTHNLNTLHSWNIIKINDNYYYVDATWDSETAPYYSYYLKGTTDFQDHIIDPKYTTTDFYTTYPVPLYEFNENDSDVIPTLLAPTKLTLSLSDGHDDIKATWTKVSGASGYYVYYKKASASSYELLEKTTKTYSEKINLTDGTKYTFKVVPYYTSNSKTYKSKNYKTSTIYTLRNLAAPSKVKLSLTDGHDDVKATWSKVPNASGYYVYYKKASASSYELLEKTTKTSSKKTNLADATKYTFKIVPYYIVDSKTYKDNSSKSASIYTLKKAK